MVSRQRQRHLNDRDRKILELIVGTYVLTGEPVSSRAIAKLERLGVSAATIRNAMADLEEMGYLSQPHTSAGRVPTGSAYHLYIDSLMPNQAVPEEARRFIEDKLIQTPPEGEPLVSAATEVLSKLTDLIGIVITPIPDETVLRAVSFVPVSGRLVHCFLVSEGGFVDNKLIETKEEMDRDDLIRISNYLTDNFLGLTLRRIRERLLAMMSEERAQVDGLMASAITLARKALEGEEAPDLFFKGTAQVLSRPELSDLERVRRMFDTFSDKARLVQMLSQLIEGEGVRVVIGQDSDLTSELDFSLVATQYGVGDRGLGRLGIFGPSRMDYQSIIPLVDYLGERLSQALEKAYGVND